MAASKTGPRSRKTYPSLTVAMETIRSELVDFPGQTSRSFWVNNRKYIVRKTNRGTDYLSLSTTKQ